MIKKYKLISIHAHRFAKNHIVEKINKLLFITLLLMPAVLYAQMSPNTNDLSEKMARFSNSLFTVETKVYSKKYDLNGLLTNSPVHSGNIEEQISDLEKAISDATLDSAREYDKSLKQFADDLLKRQTDLHAQADNVKLLKKHAEQLAQLWSNPISKAELLPDEQLELPRLLQRAKKTIKDFEEKNKLLDTDLKKINQYQDILIRWQDAIISSILVTQAEKSATIAEQLSQEQRKFEEQADSLQGQLVKNRAHLSNHAVMELQVRIHQSRTHAWLTDVNRKLSVVMSSLVPDDRIDAFNVEELEKRLVDANANLSVLKSMIVELEKKHKALTRQNELTNKYGDLLSELEETQKVIAYQIIKQEPLPKKISDILLNKNQSTLMMSQPWWHNNIWYGAKNNAGEATLKILFQVRISVQTLWEKMVDSPVLTAFTALMSLIAMVAAIKFNRHLQKRNLKESVYDRWVISTLRKTLDTLGLLRYWITGALFVLLLVRFLPVPSLSEQIIRLLVWCFIVTCVVLVILSREARLKYLLHRLVIQAYFWFVLLIATTLMYGLSVFSLVDDNVQILSEKALMLGLICFSATLFRIARYYAIKEQQSEQHRFYGGYRNFLIAMPLLVAISAVVSLLGYPRFTWLFLDHLFLFLILWVAIIVGFSLIDQLRKEAKLYSLKIFKHGVFVAQDIVSPLSLIAKLAWFYGASLWLFHEANWSRSSYIVTKFLSTVEHPLMMVGETVISVKMLATTVLAFYLIFRIARWLKRFGYHWVFAKVSDLGIRHSLSIFGQYLFTLIGVLVALKLIGIDLTSLAVFAGALGVGIGLGLQDIAKNFVSGILLLIERPLRAGDWVKLDDNEGFVKSIGLRAITMETFDKQEVVIPNGNAINNSFTNYTHSDDITRTVLYVGASYSCPPKKVLQVLMETIKSVDEVLTEPEIRVIMWEYADSCINYRIQYCVDVSKSYPPGVQTDVLSAIWYAFDENNIEIPFPQQDIYFKNTPPKQEFMDSDAEIKKRLKNRVDEENN